MPRKSKFTEATVCKLIQEVKRRPCLWNNEDDDYNDRYQMSVAWENISNIFDIPVDTIRMKWKGLRDFFKRLVRKGDMKDVEEYAGGWRHFKSLWFLYKPVLAHNGEESGEEETNPTVDNVVKCEPLEFSESEVFVEEHDPIPDKRPRKSCDDDFDEMFLKSLTPFFKELEPIRKLVVRSKIQEILLNEIAAQNTSGNKFY